MNDNLTPESNEPPVEGGTPTDRRPLGYWLRVVDRLITREFAAALEGEGVTRRDWMLLNILSGDVDAPGLAERIGRGKRLTRLVDRGWVVADADGHWQLSDEGRAAHARLAELVQGVRAKVSGAVSPEDWATLTASLEAIARDLGWDENDRMPRGRRPGGRFGGPGFGPAPFGPGPFGSRRFGSRFDAFDDVHAVWAARLARAGFGPGHGQGHWFDPDSAWAMHDRAHGGHRPHHGEHAHHGEHPHHDHGARRDRRGDGGRKAERAYERGFDAGFRAANRPGGAADAASGSAA